MNDFFYSLSIFLNQNARRREIALSRMKNMTMMSRAKAKGLLLLAQYCSAL
jgi:hypothetical protein